MFIAILAPFILLCASITDMTEPHLRPYVCVCV